MAFGGGHAIPARSTHKTVREDKTVANMPNNPEQCQALLFRTMMNMFGGATQFDFGGAAGGNLANLQLFGNPKKRQKMIENISSSGPGSSSSAPPNSSMLQLENGDTAPGTSKGPEKSKSQGEPVGDMFEIPEISPAKPADAGTSAEDSVEAVAKAVKNRERAKKEKKADEEVLKTPKSKPKGKSPAKARAKAGSGPPAKAKAGTSLPIDSPMSAEKVPVMKQGDPTFHWRDGKVQRNGGNWRCFKHRTDRKDRKFKIGATEEAEKESFVRALKWIEEPE